MSVKVQYFCDRCETKVPNQTELRSMEVKIGSYGNLIRKDWCEKCIVETNPFLWNEIQRRAALKVDNPPPAYTFEDFIRELVREEIAQAQ